MAPATGSTVLRPKPPEQTSGTRRHQLASSSPSGKGDRDTQHAKKKVRAMDLNQPEGMEGVSIGDTTNMATTEEINMDDSSMKNPPENENVWTQRTNKLFQELSKQDEWYVADSDSEDIASAMREEDDVLDEEEIDPLCPPILFTAAEKTSFRRAWRSALVVKGLSRKLPDLPIEFYNPVAVRRIASSIGKPVRVDRATKEGARGKYERVCVEIDLSKRLLPRYKVEGIPYLVVYEGLDKICTDCGMYGAETSLCMCKKIPDADVMATDTNKVQHEHEPQTESTFGGWMMGRKRRLKFQACVPPKQHLTQPPITQRQPPRFQSSNRFGALGENTTEELLHVDSNDKAHIDTLEA
ncbi:hypothetical protein LINGRAHAP2_LOCUS2281 [Linum grandiflorum]